MEFIDCSKKKKEKSTKEKEIPPGSMLSTQGSPLCAANLLFLLDSFVLFCLLLDLYLCALIPRWCTACFSFFSFFSCRRAVFSLFAPCAFFFFSTSDHIFFLFLRHNAFMGERERKKNVEKKKSRRRRRKGEKN